MWVAWPTDGPLKKRQVGHRKAVSAPAKQRFRHEIEKIGPEMTKGIRGASRGPLRGPRGRHSRQPWTLRVHPSLWSGPLLRTWTADVAPASRAVHVLALATLGLPSERTPAASFRGGGAAAPAHVRINKKERGPAAAGPPACGHGKQHAPAWADARATGLQSGTPGGSSGESIPTLRMARAPAQAGARATGRPPGTPGEIPHEAAGWLPTAEGL